MSFEHIQPDGLFNSEPLGFTQVVTSPPGKHIYLAGQVGMDADMKVVGEGDLGAQALQAVKNLELALSGAGATLDHLTHVRVYVTDLGPGSYPALGPALAKLKGSGKPPAQTLLGVQALAMPDLMIEIEGTAVIPG